MSSRHAPPHVPSLASRFPAEAFRDYPVEPEPETHYALDDGDICGWCAEAWPCEQAQEVAA
jgi:hypothetical protein